MNHWLTYFLKIVEPKNDCVKKWHLKEINKPFRSNFNCKFLFEKKNSLLKILKKYANHVFELFAMSIPRENDRFSTFYVELPL